MLPVVALTCQVPGFSAQALKDRERRLLSAVLQQLIRHAGLRVRPWRRLARPGSSSLATAPASRPFKP